MSSMLFIVGFWSTILLQFFLLPVLLFSKLILGLIPKKHVLFLENFPVNNSGYYYRAHAWSELLKQEGYSSQVKTIIQSEQRWNKWLKDEFGAFLLYSMWKRYFQLFTVFRYDAIIVRRELLFFNEYGHLYLDRILNTIHKNVILDVDDDLGASKGEPRKVTSLFGRLLWEKGTKFQDSIILYKRFICGSEYLNELVYKLNPSAEVSVIPTCSEIFRLPKTISEKRVLGWIGATGNLEMLDLIVSLLNDLADEHLFKLVTISGKAYEPKIQVQFEIEHVPWNRERDKENLALIDVGLMPLDNNRFTRGKCGFKLVQYMAQGIPAIGQKIHPNDKIIDKFGWLVDDSEEWKSALTQALTMSKSDLENLGIAAQRHISEHYSFHSNLKKLKRVLNLLH
jgi:glycosyltransferase involved in cell wall biosynthesis